MDSTEICDRPSRGSRWKFQSLKGKLCNHAIFPQIRNRLFESTCQQTPCLRLSESRSQCSSPQSRQSNTKAHFRSRGYLLVLFGCQFQGVHYLLCLHQRASLGVDVNCDHLYHSERAHLVLQQLSHSRADRFPDIDAYYILEVLSQHTWFINQNTWLIAFMSLLSSLIESFIREVDERQPEQTTIQKHILQVHPVVYLTKCAEILTDMNEISPEYLRILKLVMQVANILKADAENAVSAVKQTTVVLKNTINKLLAQPNEEAIQLVTDIHVKLMGVFEELIINHISDFFESGRVPESLILKIIQSIFLSATKEYFRMFAYEILQKILSSLSLVKTDPVRLEYCDLLQQIYKTLLYFEENQIQINTEQVQNVSWLIFDQISKDWLSANTQVQVLSLIGFMSQFVTKDKLERSLERLNGVYLSVLKQKNNQLRPLFEGFNKFLERLFKLDRQGYEQMIKSITVSLYDFYKSPIFSPNHPFDPNLLKCKNDLLQLLQTLSKFNIDNCLDLFIARINSKEQIERVSCLWICNFILSRNFNAISEPYKKQLVMQILNLQFEQDSEVRFAICEIIQQVCFKLKDEEVPINSTYLDMKALMFYLFQQVAIHDKEIEEYGRVRSAPFETTLEILKQRAQKILSTLSQDAYFHDLLWPMGLDIINNQKFSPGLSHIFKCFTLILQKSQKPTIYPNPHVIIVRILLLVQIPYFFPNMGLEALNFLPHLIKSFELKMPTAGFQHIETLKGYLAVKKPIDEFYEEKVQQIWKLSLQLFIQTKELAQIEEDFQAQMSTYLNSQALKLPIMKMQATLMSFLNNQETIKYNLDRLFNICHQEYTNQALNLNIQVGEPEFQMRLCVAECFGYIGERHTQLVLDKVKAILNCEVIQRKNTGSFKDSVFSMFQRQGTEESLSSFRSTLIMAYGCLAKQVNLEVLEKSILPNVIPFVGNEQLFNSLQIALENISKAIERQLENNDDNTSQQFLLSYSRNRENILAFTQKFMNKGSIFRTLNTMNIQLRLTLTPQEFVKVQQQLQIHLESKYDLDNEQQSQTFQNLFLLFLGSVKLVDNEQSVAVWQSLLYLLTAIKSIDPLLEVLQRSIQRVKLKLEQGYRNYFRVLLVLLSIIYKNSPAKRSAVLIIEKVMISLGVYLDIYKKTDQEFNDQIIEALKSKLQAADLQLFVQEITNIIEEPIEESLAGFVSLIQSLYAKGNRDLQKIIQLLRTICNKAYQSQFQANIVKELLIIMGHLIDTNLNPTLQILLEYPTEFPVGSFNQHFLSKVVEQKGTLVKSFSFLTDVLNNPEEIISADIGNYLVNASLFIGQMLATESQILQELIPKFKAQILSTFILRFMTCHDMKLCGGNQSVHIAIWSFQNLLNITQIEGISQSVFKKLLSEDEVQDGIQEIMLIYCKGSTFAEHKKVFDFLEPFTTKKHASYRLAVIVAIGQFVRYHKDYKHPEFYQNLLQTLLRYDEDDSELVRSQVAQGLGALSYCLRELKHEERKEAFPTELIEDILGSLINCLEDSQEVCIRSAMISLQNLVDELPDTVQHLSQLMLNTTTNFEKQQTKIRISAFSLFSKLCHICHKQNIMNQELQVNLRQALISIMLHLLDESVQVRQVCKLSLENIGEILQKPVYKQLSNGEIEEGQYPLGHLEDHEKIIFIMTMNLEEEHLQSYIKGLVEFCKSPEYNIKGAAMFSLVVLLAFRNVGESRLQIEGVCAEGKLKWQTKSLVMKAAVYLTEK